jgi:DNA-binding transcriptional regulator GbsR (MarR family)
MAEVHALLFITGLPLCTDDVMDRLAISRGNASMSLRALLDWGVIARAHKRGDRKEYFLAESDVWTILKAVVRERMKREVQPVLASLYDIRDMTRDLAAPADSDTAPLNDHHRRLDDMIALLATFDRLGEKFVELPLDQLRDTAELLAGTASDAPAPTTPPPSREAR